MTLLLWSSQRHPDFSPHSNAQLQRATDLRPLNTIGAMQKMSSDSETEYVSWTPEELMRDYRGEIKRDIFVLIMEWYSNAEVEAKINDNRTDGKKIQNPNFYAEIKRNVDNIALREGRLPTEYRLQWDKRRVANLEVRFGHDNISVRMMRQSIAAREAVKGELTRSHPYSEPIPY